HPVEADPTLVEHAVDPIGAEPGILQQRPDRFRCRAILWTATRIRLEQSPARRTHPHCPRLTLPFLPRTRQGMRSGVLGVDCPRERSIAGSLGWVPLVASGSPVVGCMQAAPAP